MNNFTRLTCIVIASTGIQACDKGSENKASNNQSQALVTLEQKASYSFGVDVAKGLKQQGIELDITALNKGISDAYNGDELALNDEDRLQAKTTFQAQVRDALMKEQAMVGEKNLTSGAAFLE